MEGVEYEWDDYGLGDQNELDDVEAENEFMEPDYDDTRQIQLQENVLDDLQGDQLAMARQELTRFKVDAFYDAVREKTGLTPGITDYSKFELRKDRNLYLLANGKEIRLTNRNNPSQFLALPSIVQQIGRGGAEVVRVDLGLADFTSSKKRMSRKIVEAFRSAAVDLPPVENIPLQDMSGVAKRAETAVDDILSAADVDRVMDTINDPPLPMRELVALDKALQRTRGELVNNLAKLAELDEHIGLEKRKLEEAEDDGQREALKKRISDLEDERSVRLEAAGANKDALRSQISRIRETITRVLDKDTTLREKLQTLFREQGVTIASLITALGFIISTIVLSVTGGGVGGVGPVVPSKSGTGDVKKWVKDQLKHLASLLGKLAEKAAVALPGILGSLVSWLVTQVKNAVNWLADHLWAMVAGVVAVLYFFITDLITVRNRKH